MSLKRVRWFFAASLVIAATAYGADADNAPLGKIEAARLLTQGSFGPTAAEINRVAAGNAEDWLDQQIAMPATYHLPQFQRLNTSAEQPEKNARTDVWWKAALTAPDQLRQRVAFALSEILVVSDYPDDFRTAQEGLTRYYDILVRNAFGDFRTLLEEVTLSPVMGRYLSMLDNQKPDAASGRRADENYARELMQLFTVGTVRLYQNGQPLLRDGQPVPSYSQADIEGLARALTGWTWSARAYNWMDAMVAVETRHDTDAKNLIGNVYLPAGASARQDLELALDALFRHPNVAPFIARQLIQKLVTSNPGPGYVKRVADAFNDNGMGRRGDLAAVVRAVLLDPQARAQGVRVDPDFGKAREPILRMSHLYRALSAQPSRSTGRYSFWIAPTVLGQSVLSSPSVFNFYSPRYAPAGEISADRLVAPELQLASEASLPMADNWLGWSIFGAYKGGSLVDDGDPLLVDLGPLRALAGDAGALIDQINLVFLSGQMTPAFRSTLIDFVSMIPAASDGGLARTQEALYLTISSAQYQIQR